MENIRNRCKIEFIRKDDNEKIVKQQSKLTLMEFINLMKIMIVIHLNKMKF